MGDLKRAKINYNLAREIHKYQGQNTSAYFLDKKIAGLTTKGFKGLLKKLFPVVIPSIGIIAAIFFVSPNLTGNVIGNFSTTTSNIIAGLLFFFVILGVIYLLNKKKNKVSASSKKQVKKNKKK